MALTGVILTIFFLSFGLCDESSTTTFCPQVNNLKASNRLGPAPIILFFLSLSKDGYDGLLRVDLFRRSNPFSLELDNTSPAPLS